MRGREGAPGLPRPLGRTSWDTGVFSEGTLPKPQCHVLVCLNTRPADNPKGSCTAKGSEDVWNAFKAEVAQAGLQGRVMVTRTGCLKHCSRGVTVAVQPDNVWYSRVTPRDVAEIVAAHIGRGEAVERLLMPDIPWE